jgi:hypothetical protein
LKSLLPEAGKRPRFVLEAVCVEREKRALQARWSERERQIDAFAFEVAGIYGDLQGLGAAPPAIEQLELPASFADDVVPLRAAS